MRNAVGLGAVIGFIAGRILAFIAKVLIKILTGIYGLIRRLVQLLYSHISGTNSKNGAL